MGISYTLLLMDEFDWGYVTYKGIEHPDRKKVIDLMKQKFSGVIRFHVEADFYGCIVIDCGKWFPYKESGEDGEIARELLSFCDVCYSRADNSLLLERLTQW